jgi:peptidoglycan/xylan/chitin deacetylase (PgdA/CDA1 family)
VDIDPSSKIEPENININLFKKQLVYLKKNFEIVSIDEFCSRYSRNKLNHREIVLTFDDGYRNNLDVLAPLMLENDVPFTVFISTNHIEQGKLFPTSVIRIAVFSSLLDSLNVSAIPGSLPLRTQDDKELSSKKLSDYVKKNSLESVNTLVKDIVNNFTINDWELLRKKHSSLLPMSWDEVRKLISYGATIGSHCEEHICCHSNQNSDVVKKQIFDSKKVIEKELGITCSYFAYPNGNYTDISKEYTLEAGYLAAFTTEKNKLSSLNNQLNAMPRHSVPYDYDTFRVLISLPSRKG